MQARSARREPLLLPRLPRSPALKAAPDARRIPHAHRACCQGSTLHMVLILYPVRAPARGGSPGAGAQICMVCTSQLRSERPPLSSRKMRLCPTATITCSGCAMAQRRNCPTRSCRQQACGQAYACRASAPACCDHTKQRNECTRLLLGILKM